MYIVKVEILKFFSFLVDDEEKCIFFRELFVFKTKNVS